MASLFLDVYSNSSILALLLLWPKSDSTSVTCTEALVQTAAWLETLTAPGMASPALGITQLARMQSGETVLPWNLALI